MTRHRGRTVAILLALGVALASWVVFAPEKLGGSTIYSVTAGVSMQPLLYRNDLALVRTRSSYGVGDVVLYNSALLHPARH